MEVERKSFRVEAKADAEPGTFRGYMSVWGNVDSYGDVMVRGAFDASIKTRGLPMLSWEHEWREGPIGVLTETGDDDKGQWVEGRIFTDSDLPRRVHESMKAGGIGEMSFAFLPKETTTETQEGEEVRLVKAVDWLEAAIVVKGANDEAKLIAVRKQPETKTVDDDDAALAAALDRIIAQGAAERQRADYMESLTRLRLSEPAITNEGAQT